MKTDGAVIKITSPLLKVIGLKIFSIIPLNGIIEAIN